MKDLVKAEHVEICVDAHGKLWVNVDGICVLRIQSIKTITYDDPVRGKDLTKFSSSAVSNLTL